MCALGLDIGTCYLVCARKDAVNPEGNVKVNSIRDAFLDIEAEASTMNMLKMSNVSYVKEGDMVYVVGEPALNIANLLKREARRPLSQGVISSGELDAERMLLILLKNILGDPKVEDENVFYSVPAKSIDMDMDVIYHEAMFKKIIESMGYKATAMNEAAAIVYANCANDGFTALATSCLTPGQRVITDRGFTKIEEIEEGVQILTKEGKWVPCKPTSRNYSGDVYKISSYGGPSFEVTEDHLVWIGRDGKWDWVAAKEVIEGDFIQQPWDNFNMEFLPGKKRPYICFEERVTSSKETDKKVINLTDDMAELLGFWLGDGHLEKEKGAICITQSNLEEDNIDRISYLVNSVFDKDVSVYKHGENSCRIKFYGKAFMTWLLESCYDEKGMKKIPWKASELNDSVLMSMLRGLIATDGYISEEKKHVGFTNTSDSLAQFVYLALQRLGCNTQVYNYLPREGSNPVEDGHVINGKKDIYTVSSSGYYTQSFIQWYKNPYKTMKKSYIHGSTVVKVSSVESSFYNGPVYDVSIEDKSHSFCLPGAAIHNCGAGMVNTSLLFQTMVGMSFSVSRSGDWIDQSVAKAVGSTATRVMMIKEKGVDLMNPQEGDPKNLREREAIAVYYKNLIHYVIENIKNEFKRDNSSIELPESIPWIVSGGTSLAKNFLPFFKQEFNKERATFPINISEIRAAKDPLNDVANGLLIAAMNE